MTGIRRVSQLGTTGESTYVDGSIKADDIGFREVTQIKLSTDISLSGMRNVIINGGMDIWQRGTGSIAPGNGSMTNTDRWTHTGVGTTFTQQTDVPDGLRYSLGVSGSDPSFGQKIEAANSARLAGQSITFTIWAKNVSGSTSLFFNFYYPNSVDNFSSLTTIFSYTISTNMSASWTRYQIGTSLPANVVNGLYILVGRSAGASNTYYTGAQLEARSQATPFEQRPIGTELALCQRYYQIGRLAAAGYGIVATVDSGAYGNFSFPTRMRATPTITELTKALGGSPAGYGSGTTYIDASGFGFRYNHGGGGGGSGSGNLSFDLTWSAASEL